MIDSDRPRIRLSIFWARGLRDLGDGLVAVVLPAYLLALGYGAGAIGLVATAALLGSAILTMAVGFVGARHDPRFLLLAAALLMTATGLVFGFAGSLAVLFFCALVGTINPSAGSVSIFAPLEQAMLTHASPDVGRTAVFARYSLIGSLAAAVGALGAGFVDVLVTAGLSELSALRVPFWIYAVLGIGCWLAYRAMPSSAHEWSRECFAKGNASCSQPLSQPFREIFQYFAAPGQPLPVCGLFAGGKDLCLPFGEVRFNGSAEMFRSHRRLLFHGADTEQGRCLVRETVSTDAQVHDERGGTARRSGMSCS